MVTDVAHRVQIPVPGRSGNGGNSPYGSFSKPASTNRASGERRVKRLRLSKALIISEGTTVSEACLRLAARRVDAVLLTDANEFLSGIVTAKDVATRVVAEGLDPEKTIISKIMTRNPTFVMADTLAIEALQKMIQGKFKHLPVVENGEVIAMLNIAKCLFDAISRIEKAMEQGNAITAALKGLESQMESKFSVPYTFTEALHQNICNPVLSTIISENVRVVLVSPSDSVYVATKKMLEFQVYSVIVATRNGLQGVLTSKDVVMCVVAQHLSPELTPLEKVMTANTECATMEMTILEALHLTRDSNFLYLPVLSREDHVVACLDVLQVTSAVILMVSKFRFFILITDLYYACITYMSSFRVEGDTGAINGVVDIVKRSSGILLLLWRQDIRNMIHIVSYLLRVITSLLTNIKYYEDNEGDKVLLSSDDGLVGAINHAKLTGWKVLRLHIDDPGTNKIILSSKSGISTMQRNEWTSLRAGILAGTIAVTSIGVMVYLKRSKV
uniref:CBS domain-containing protein n=1 Tax=Musa acuminata subsp. malaccensis TaxID=214687 RepID=A0A804JE68_MUSAM